MRAVKYGVTRDYVRGLEVVLADGTVMQVGGKQVKDASGLSLKHLLIGSEGTLAVSTKCLLRLVPKPEASLSVLVPYADLKTGIQQRFDHPAREREPHGGRIHGAQSRRAWRTLLRCLLSAPRRRLLYSA